MLRAMRNKRHNFKTHKVYNNDYSKVKMPANLYRPTRTAEEQQYYGCVMSIVNRFYANKENIFRALSYELKDLVQEAFLKVLKILVECPHLGHVCKIKKIKVYVRNHLIDLLRQASLRLEYNVESVQDTLDGMADNKDSNEPKRYGKASFNYTSEFVLDDLASNLRLNSDEKSSLRGKYEGENVMQIGKRLGSKRTKTSFVLNSAKSKIRLQLEG